MLKIELDISFYSFDLVIQVFDICPNVFVMYCANKNSSSQDFCKFTLVRTIRVIMRKNDARTLHLCTF